MKVAFASIELVLDFPTMESAKSYEDKARKKGWYIERPVYENGGGELPYSLVVRRPYKDYNAGW